MWWILFMVLVNSTYHLTVGENLIHYHLNFKHKLLLFMHVCVQAQLFEVEKKNFLFIFPYLNNILWSQLLGNLINKIKENDKPMAMYVPFWFNLSIVSKNNYFVHFQIWPYVRNYVLWWQPSWMSIWQKNTRTMHCKGPSTEHFSHVCCQMILRILKRIIFKYFPIGSYIKFALWQRSSWISNRHKID